jgi:xylitol oxidase
MHETNWAGNHTYPAHTIHRPRTVGEVREIVATAPCVRVLGTRHSFSDIADGDGSGDTTGNLATAVAGMQLVTSSGDVMDVTRDDPGFDGMAVGLGALGVVARLTLDVEPSHEIVQRTYEGLPFEALLDDLDAIMAAGYSVSVLTDWGPTVDRVWVKHRVDAGTDPEARGRFHGVAPVTDDAGDRAVPGAWSDRLPLFSMDATPSVGEELQAEYFVARRHGVAALRAVRELADVVQPVLHISEIRTVTADRLWMSPQYRQETLAIAFTLTLDPDAVARTLVHVEAALAPFDARPHWGKLFHHDATAIAALYERRDDFVRLVERVDARGALRNAWLRHRVLGD